MMDEEKLPYKSREMTISVPDTDEVLWQITTDRKFRLMSLKVLNLDETDPAIVILTDNTGAGSVVKETLSVDKLSMLLEGEHKFKGIEFEQGIIYVSSTIAGTIIRIGGLEY